MRLLPMAAGILAAVSVAYAADDVPRAISTLKNIAAQEVKGSNDKIPDWLKRTDISVEGIDTEEVRQPAANIQSRAKVHNKDLRKFLDGIYVYSKE